MNLSRHTVTVLFVTVPMGSGAVCTCGYLYILLTIRRSISYILFTPDHILIVRYFRVLVATIRDKGRCPCPRCLVTFDEIPNLGTESDRKIREDRARCDDGPRREKVLAARARIYNDGYAVGGDKADEDIKDTSLVPTIVMLSA
jgi:hypothetical protein